MSSGAHTRVFRSPHGVVTADATGAALELAGELLGRPLELPLGPGEPESGRAFRRLRVRRAVVGAVLGALRGR
jgi:hypothetical protein